MFTLPRQNSSFEAVTNGKRTYVPGRNLPDTPFRQFSSEGTMKKEFLPYKSSGPDDSVSDEAKQLNWGNMQQKLTADNLDDMAQDLLKIKSGILEEK